VLDAAGALATPGFVDAHAHSDITAFLDPSAACRVHEGVTTEFSGTCGYSLFPLADKNADEIRRALQSHRLDPDWQSAGQFFDRLQSVGTAINRGFFVGHGTVRAAVMGYDSRPPKRLELRAMKRIIAESLEEGALGLSSGLIYPPGCFARPVELKTLCTVAAQFGRPYATHMRNEGDYLLGSLRETLDFARASGVALHISHLKVSGPHNWWKFNRMKKAITAARRQGIDLSGDRYPYTAGQTSLYTLLPEQFLEGGAKQALTRLNNPRVRLRLKADLVQHMRGKNRWESVVIARAEGESQLFEGMNLRQVAQLMRKHPADAVFTLLTKTRMSASAIFFTQSPSMIEDILTWPFVCIGSDSAARATRGPTAIGKPHPRTFGSFGRFLSEYVMKRKRLSLADAIARVTSLPAARFGLKDRGVLRRGAWADIAVFNPHEFRDRATYENPFRLSAGMRHLLVNGVPVLENGRRTRARPGKVLRIGQ